MILKLIYCLITLFFYEVKLQTVGNLKVVSDLLPADCYALGLDYAVSNGLPYCKTFKGTSGKKCSKFYNPRSILYFNTVSRPVCQTDGLFSAKQCKGERTTGRCFCFTSEGKRIFGQEWWSKAKNMTCACSRRKAEMQALPDAPYFNSLHCNSMGNYEPLQCDVLSGQCWCVEEKTGKLTSPVVPEKAMAKLPCYQSSKIGTQYLRQCESKKYAQSRILYVLKIHGTYASFSDFLCDDDGSYGAYKLVDGSAYCTWRDNTNLGTYEYGQQNRSILNCNCARDGKIFQLAGKTRNQKCSSGGNYQALQALGGSTYCVDTDGYIKTHSKDTPVEEGDCDQYLSF